MAEPTLTFSGGNVIVDVPTIVGAATYFINFYSVADDGMGGVTYGTDFDCWTDLYRRDTLGCVSYVGAGNRATGPTATFIAVPTTAGLRFGVLWEGYDGGGTLIAVDGGLFPGACWLGPTCQYAQEYDGALGPISGWSGQTVEALFSGPAPARVATCVSPEWRFFVTNLAGEGITDLSKIASDRAVTKVLNGPLKLEGKVPSDNVQVWTKDATDNDPFLAEGTRLLWGFRREYDTSPYYVCRAATICELIEDAAEQDDGRSSFTGWDPWQYLFSRPVCKLDGTLPGKNGISWTATQASVVIAQLLRNTIVNHGHAYIDAGSTYGGTVNYDGTLETGAGMVIDINFAQGTSVGEAWQKIAAMNVCDIVLDPIYRPGPPSSTSQANYLCQLNVYAQAGSVRDEVIFAWNLPSRSLVQISRLQEGGLRRANNVKLFAGPGGSAGGGQTIAVQADATSVAKYGEYWAQQFFPGETVAAAVLSIAERQLELRKNGRETVTFRPAPERSPCPWVDYDLGDRVVVWASKEGMRELLGATVSGTTTTTQYQRVYGWRTNISDDALETIDPLMVSDQGFTG